jgi:hypothetical protein
MRGEVPARMLPWPPVWTGWLANNALFALAWLLLLFLSGVRGWWRRRRGRCARCGYDLRSMAGVCPECGHQDSRGGLRATPVAQDIRSMRPSIVGTARRTPDAGRFAFSCR